MVRLGDETLLVVKPGDRLRGSAARVLEIQGDRLVLEERVPQPGRPDLQSARTVWIYRSVDGRSSRIQILEPQPPASEPRHQPLIRDAEELPSATTEPRREREEGR